MIETSVMKELKQNKMHQVQKKILKLAIRLSIICPDITNFEKYIC